MSEVAIKVSADLMNVKPLVTQLLRLLFDKGGLRGVGATVIICLESDNCSAISFMRSGGFCREGCAALWDLKRSSQQLLSLEKKKGRNVEELEGIHDIKQ